MSSISYASLSKRLILKSRLRRLANNHPIRKSSYSQNALIVERPIYPDNPDWCPEVAVHAKRQTQMRLSHERYKCFKFIISDRYGTMWR